jgi:hypothetical protein
MSNQHSELRDLIDTYFSLSDIRQLCVDLSVDYEHLGGDTKPSRIISLIEYLQRRGRLPDLAQRCRELRRHVPWPTLDPESRSADRPPSHEQQTPPANPFGRAGKLQDSASYLVRPTLTNQLFDELRKGVSLSIVGESQTGKSSLLWHITQTGPAVLQRPPADFVYLSLELIHSDDDLFDCISGELGIAPARGFRLARALHGRHVILCLDEIEKMTWDGFSLNVRTELRGLADGPDAPFSLIIASRSPLGQLFPDSPLMTSPLAGLCIPVAMPPFTLAESHALARQYLQGTGLSLPAAAVERAWQQSHGHPARLQQALKVSFAEIFG